MTRMIPRHTPRCIPRILLCAVLGLAWMGMEGQGVWDDPFESTRRAYRPAAWTVHLGTDHVMGLPSSWNSSWVVNRGTDDAPQLDTLHDGLWRAQPRVGARLGLGHLWLREDALWADRVVAGLDIFLRRNEEMYVGWVKPWEGTLDNPPDSVLAFTDIRRSSQAAGLGWDIQAMRGKSTGPDGFVEFQTGLRGAYHLIQSLPSQDTMMFSPAQLPLWHVAWTLGVGAGVKIWRGRIVRLTVSTDALQLAKAPSNEPLRPLSAGVAGLDWMQGSYRPWRVSVHADLYRRKPAEGCAAPTRSTSSKTLWDPKMKGTSKAKHKGLQKALERRAEEDDW
ncbi:MAG: hypothetical protein O2791_02395 [Bacteroidetes bacterium]|nr:hypothetical protein [Bacteroidota bacterium]